MKFTKSYEKAILDPATETRCFCRQQVADDKREQKSLCLEKDSSALSHDDNPNPSPGDNIRLCTGDNSCDPHSNNCLIIP